MDDRGPLRVMFVITCMPVGGAERLLVELIRGLDRTKFLPELCCLKYPGPLGEMLAKEVPTFSGLLAHKYDFGVLRRLTRLMQSRRTDAVVTVGTGGDKMFWGRLAGWFSGAPVICSALHSTGLPDHVELPNRLLAPITDAFIAVAKPHGVYLTQHEGCPARKVQVIPNGVDTRVFHPRWPNPALKKELGLEDDAPVRPLEPRSTGSVSAPRGNRLAAPEAGGPLGDAVSQDERATGALRFVASFGALLSRCLDPINRLERGLPPFPVEVAGGTTKDSDAYPVIRLKPLDEDETPFWDPSRRQRLLARARQWVEKPAAWAARLTDRDRPGTPPEPETLRAAEPGQWEARQAPPAIAELPVLRFATVHEPAVVADVYEGDEGEGIVPVGWLWTKRLGLGATLLAGATLGALTFETWSPRAAEIGETTLSEIDGRVRSHHLAGQRQKAVAEVADGLPQLDPETIGLVMAASPTGLLDAAGVFELACDATDRGVSALTASDARDLEALQQRLLHALLPGERERLREFDLARAREAVFPIDGRQALLAHARGTRQLPPADRERLRLLLGRAISAGLARPRQAATGDAATL